MRITYLTLDEVNRFLLQRWAGQCDCRVDCPTANHLYTLPGTTDAVVLDLDYLPAPLRAAWLARILAGALTDRVLVHGHNITDTEAAALRQLDVTICHGRLRRRLVRSWLGAQRQDALVLRSHTLCFTGVREVDALTLMPPDTARIHNT